MNKETQRIVTFHLKSGSEFHIQFLAGYQLFENDLNNYLSTGKPLSGSYDTGMGAVYKLFIIWSEVSAVFTHA